MKHMPFYLMDIWYGEQSIDLFGSKIKVGDIDGDGIEEVIVSSPTSSTVMNEYSVNPKELVTAGKVSVYKGRDRKLVQQWVGQNQYAHFGYAIALGDVNGDGIQEIIISSPYEGNETTIECGAVHVYSGITGTLLYTIYGSSNYQRLGYVIETGDVNGDRYDDLIITSSLYDEEGKIGTGMVEVYSGKDGTLLGTFTTTEDIQFGYSLAIADLNKDGCQEIIIGAPEASATDKYRCGRVYVYSGKDGSLIQQFEGAKARDRFGTALATGDVDGDKHPDLVIASSRESSNGLLRNGSVRVYSGESFNLMMELFGDINHLNLGKKILLADIDQDGIEEIILSTSGHYILVLDGRNGQEIKKIYGESNVYFGSALAAGDVDGDVKAELLISSLATLHEGELKGAIYLFTPDPNPTHRGSIQSPK